MNNVRVDRMLRELHAEPPLQFFEALFSLTGMVMKQVAAVRASRAREVRRPTAPIFSAGAAD